MFVRLFMGLALLAAFSAVPALARGGNEDIGGGDVVRFDDGYRPIVLDYFVGAKLGYFDGFADLTRAMGASPSEAPERKVRRVLARVAHFDPDLAADAAALLRTFLTTARYVPGPVADVPDENLETSLGAHGHLVQAAVWERDAAGDISSWRVDAGIWRQLDSIERAGLMLHEIFYVLHDARIRKTPGRRLNARYVRQFVASISSSWMTACSRDEWDSLMAAMRLF